MIYFGKFFNAFHKVESFRLNQKPQLGNPPCRILPYQVNQRAFQEQKSRQYHRGVLLKSYALNLRAHDPLL